MKISKKQIIAGIIYTIGVTYLFGFKNLHLFLGFPFLIIVGYIVVNASTKDGVKLGKRGTSIFTSSKPYNYNKYRRGYRNRK